MIHRLTEDFYGQSALMLAPSLLGKVLVRRCTDGSCIRSRITETECYVGEEDGACHARFGKTARTAVMYENGELAYIYLCYGLHYLLNVVSGKRDFPEAVLIRETEDFPGPARLTKAMSVTKALNGIDLSVSQELWIEDDGFSCIYETYPRIGIDYAAEPYKSIEWRFRAVFPGQQKPGRKQR